MGYHNHASQCDLLAKVNPDVTTMPRTSFDIAEKYDYQTGFAANLESVLGDFGFTWQRC